MRGSGKPRQTLPWTADGTAAIVLQYGAFATLLFGIKLWLIQSYGNATPFGDQWPVEANQLFKAFLEGSLRWSVFVAAANEHRILTARLLALALLAINGVWNPLLEMVAGAGLHIAAITVGIALLIRVIGRDQLPAVLVFSVCLFGIPFGWENTLGGFTSQFYFLLLFSLAGLWLLVTHEPLSLQWSGGVLCAVLGFLSVASGILTFATAAIIGVVFHATGLRKSRGQATALGILAALFVLGVAWTPAIPHNATLRAASLPQFLEALAAVFGWPLASTAVAALIRNLPALIFLSLMLRTRPPANDRRWFLLAVVVWSIGQAVSIAYGRSVGSLAPRYADLNTIAILIVYVCLICVIQASPNGQRFLAIAAGAVWTLTVLVSGGWYAIQTLPAQLDAKRAMGLAQETTTRCYVATGDLGCLKDKPPGSVAFPHLEPLAEFLSSSTIQSILPANISRPLVALSIESNPAHAFVPNGYDATTPSRSGVTLGSYGAQGAAGKGQALMRFPGDTRSDVLAIPVAGYPLRTGIKITIEQDGRRVPVVLRSNPGASWGIARARIGRAAFSLHLTDASSTDWLAVGAPTVVGRLDKATNALLVRYPAFIVLGVAAWVFAVLFRGLAGGKQVHSTD